MVSAGGRSMILLQMSSKLPVVDFLLKP